MAFALLRKALSVLSPRQETKVSEATRLTHEEIVAAGNVRPEPSAEYLTSLEALDNVVRDCIAVSKQYAGIASPTSKHFYASVLFTSLISRGVSLAMLAPHSPWADKMIEHWDYASASVIVRTMVELRAAFHYLCIDACSDDEWQCRWNLLNLHDCTSRKRLREAQGADAEEISQFDQQADGLRSRLKSNPHFQGIAHQQRLLNGQVAYLYPLEQMLERAGLEKSIYRWLNVLFSSHVHGLPMSYYRMGEQERGGGLPSPIEEGYTSLCHSLAVTLLVGCRDETRALFEGLI